MNPRATRMADMVASVPEFTRRTISMDGTASQIASASSISCSVGAPKLVPISSALRSAAMISGWSMAEQQRAPGADVVDVLVAVDVERCDPSPRAMKRGCRRRCGMRAPANSRRPGVTFCARAKQLFRAGVIHALLLSRLLTGWTRLSACRPPSMIHSDKGRAEGRNPPVTGE